MSGLAPTNKKDFYRRWMNLEFGNRIRMFDTQKDLRESDYHGTVSARHKVISGKSVYGVKAEFAKYEREYALMTFNETAPDDKLLFQGELMLGAPQGYALYGSTARMPMKMALVDSGIQYYGLQALGRLRHYCWPNSFDMLMELLDRYSEAVIEFGAYSCELGVIPNNNVIVWEIRNY